MSSIRAGTQHHHNGCPLVRQTLKSKDWSLQWRRLGFRRRTSWHHMDGGVKPKSRSAFCTPLESKVLYRQLDCAASS